MSGPLLHAIDRYCAAHRVAPSTFGRLAVKDPRLVSDLRAGRSITDRRAERVHSFMQSAPRTRAANDEPVSARARVGKPCKTPARTRDSGGKIGRSRGVYLTRTDDPHPILADIALFLARTGMAETMFGYHALGDYNFVEDVRCGRDVRRITERRVRAFMTEAEG